MTRRLSLRRGAALIAEGAGLADVTGRRRARLLAESHPVNGLNDLFERIVYLNLDRRSDRRGEIEDQCQVLGIEARRVAAVDGRTWEVAAEYEALGHAARPRFAPLRLALAAPRSDWLEDHALRVALLEREGGGRNLNSPGALGYLRTMAAVFRDAIRDGVDSLLVFDDDVRLHRDSQALARALAGQLPEDWAILQLGSLYKTRRIRGYHRWSANLLLVEGRLIGSHAVGWRRPLFEEALALIERFDATFDDGALTTLSARHWRRSFLAVPALAIQSLEDSDIQDESAGHLRASERAMRDYGWAPEAYLWPENAVKSGVDAAATAASTTP